MLSRVSSLLRSFKQTYSKRATRPSNRRRAGVIESLETRAMLDASYFVLSGGNLSQDWSNTGLITANDDWTGVPSIVGFLGDSSTASTTGVDPRTLTADVPTVAIDVIANQTAPNTNSSGGVAEFEIANPVVAIQGSGTADAPYLQFHLNSTGRTDVRIQANLRDIDGSADNAIQQINVQYRVGASGAWTNVTGAYFADVTTGPSLATAVTALDVTLPSGTENQGQLQVRIMTTNAGGNDEWVGIDDIVISSSVLGGDTSPPTVSSIDDGDLDDIVVANTALTYTITFNEDIDAGTLTVADFDNAGTSAITVGTITETSAGVFTVVVTPTSAGTLRLRIPSGSEVKDVAGNILSVPVSDDTELTVTAADVTPPSIVSIDDGDGDNAVVTDTALTYTVTFSEDIDSASVSAGDFDNAGTSAITIGTITETSPGVFTVQVTPTTAGTLTFRVPNGATITDLAGNVLAVPVSDNDTLTVTVPDVTPPTVTSIVDDRSGAAINANLQIVYTITFSEDINLSTVAAGDFDNAGTASISIGAIAEPNPGVLTVTVTPTSAGTLQLRIPTGAVISDPSGNNLVPPVVDDTTINVNAVTLLMPGDIAFTAFQADNTGGEFAGDAFAFVLLEPVVAGTAIFFTDNGYRTNTNAFATNEQLIRWVAQSDLPVGSKIVFVATGGTGPASNATWTGINPQTGASLSTALFQLAGGGDNIAAIQSPTFGGAEALNGTVLAQLTFGGATFASTFTTGTSHTALAPGLVDGLTAVSFAPTDNGRYNDGAFGSVEIGPKSVVSGSLNTDRFWATSGTAFTPGNSAATFGVSGSIATDLFINEVVFNPLTDPDTSEEYIELRGTPNGFVPANAYLALLEGDSETGSETAPGLLDQIFYIGGLQFGSNGYLILRQSGSTYTVASSATDVIATGTGWGTEFSSRATDIENGSVSVLLFQWASMPVADTDFDSDDNGTLDGAAASWTIRDAIGNIDGGASDTGYGFLNTTGNGNGLVPSGSSLINLGGYHPDYMARNGSSTGYALLNNTSTAWVVGELAGAMPTVSLATGGFTRPAAYEGAALNHIGAVNNFDAANSPPVAVDDNLSSIAEDSGNRTISIASLISNDTDVDGNTLSITAVSNPVGGTVSIVGSNVVFVPTLNFNGAASFEYTLSDGALTDTGLVTFTITAVNDAPVAVDDSLSSIAEDSGNRTISIASLIANDSDVDLDTLSITLVGNAVGGTVSIVGSNVVFVPTLNFNGAASFEYTLSDGSLTDTGLVTFTITAVNDAPLAVDDSLSSIAEDSGNRTISIASLIANDSDVDLDTLSITAVSNPVGGTVSIVGSNVVFVPTLNFNGAASFGYTLSDGSLTDTGLVTFTITAVNDAPVAVDDSLSSIAEDSGNRTISIASLIANDTDVDLDTLSITAVNNPVGGTVSIVGSNVVFVPTLNFNGAASFEYTLSDGALTDIGLVTFTITAVNDAPVAVDDSLSSIAEDSGNRTISIASLIANDSDVDLDTLSITAVSNPVGGTVSIVGSNVVFVPTLNFNGAASFEYTLSDGALTDTGLVTFTITAVNDAPVAVDDSLSSIAEDSGNRTISIASLISNDTDVDLDTLSITAVNNPVGGTVSIVGSNVVFVPTLNFNGAASFGYTLSDGALTDAGLVTFTITAVNDAPLAVDDSLSSIAEDSGNRTISIASLIANDSDVDLDTLSITAVSNPVGGTVSIVGSNVVFVPTLNFNGAASFDYTLSDGSLTYTGLVTFTITAVNDAPVAVDDSLSSIPENSGNRTISIASLISNDSDVDLDTLSITLVGNAVGGTVSILGSNVVFAPTLNFNGAASFEYTLSDGALTDIGLVTFTITGANDAPVAVDDSLSSIAEDSGNRTISIASLTSNDIDVDGDTLSITAVSNAVGGTVSIVGSNVVFVPTLNFNGAASFDYTLSDGALTDTGLVTFTITAVNDAPVAVDESLSSIGEDSGNRTISIASLIANDSDVDLDTLSITAVSNPVGGTVSIVGSNVVFVPTLNFNGAASFEYTLSDGSLTDTGLVTFTITAVNDAPVAVDDSLSSIAEDSGSRTISIASLIANDNDVDLDTLSITVVGNAVGGTVSIVGSNVVFVPTLNFNGAASFGYTLSDGSLTDTGLVTFTITAVNDAPTDIALSNSTLAENAGVNATVGTLSGVDVDAGDVLSFSLPAGVDNAMFNISGTTLRANNSFNFESGTTYTVNVRVSDGSLSYDEQFTITITNVNEAPTDIALSNSTLLENAGANAVVGTLSGSDPDAGASLSFSLPAGFDNARFNINGTSLRANSSFDFEAGSSYTVNVRVSDGSLSFDKQFTITILNVNEATFESNIFYNSNAASEKNFSLDQTGQRSMIRNAQIVFNGDVAIPTGAVTNSSFVLTRLGSTPASIGLTVVSRTFVAGKTTVVLGFTSGTHTVSGSLNDGNYRLVIDYGALGIDGDGNGQTGGLRTINFHRLFGDSDGDRDVDARDSANYRAGLRGNSTWLSLFDFDNDGSLLTGSLQDQQDSDAFFANFGSRLTGI